MKPPGLQTVVACDNCPHGRTKQYWIYCNKYGHDVERVQLCNSHPRIKKHNFKLPNSFFKEESK